MLKQTILVRWRRSLGSALERSLPAYFSKRRMATGTAAVLALAVGYHVVFGANGLTVYEKKRQETRALNEDLLALQRENDLLKGHVERLESDPNAIEHEAREELHYTRPGEVIYSLPNSPVTGTNPEPAGGR